MTLKWLLDAWGDRSCGPLFIIMGLFAATPFSAIPPTAAVIGLVAAAIAAQMFFSSSIIRGCRARSVSGRPQ